MIAIRQPPDWPDRWPPRPMGSAAGFPAAIHYSSGSWRPRRLKRITVAGLRCDDGGLRARRLRAERCGREAATYHGGNSSAKNPVLPAPCPTALPPAADTTFGGARGHRAEPGEKLLALPTPSSSLLWAAPCPSPSSLAPPISSRLLVPSGCSLAPPRHGSSALFEPKALSIFRRLLSWVLLLVPGSTLDIGVILGFLRIPTPRKAFCFYKSLPSHTFLDKPHSITFRRFSSSHLPQVTRFYSAFSHILPSASFSLTKVGF